MIAVQPICLPDPTKDYENKTALVTGWGNINVTGPQSDVLQEVNVSTITNQECAEYLGQRRISSAMICAGAPGKDACTGDSGGPLAVLGPDGRYSQIGIERFIQCKDQSPNFIPWIFRNSVMGKRLRKRRIPWGLHQSYGSSGLDQYNHTETR